MITMRYDLQDIIETLETLEEVLNRSKPDLLCPDDLYRMRAALELYQSVLILQSLR
jgi:hypothetical protein